MKQMNLCARIAIRVPYRDRDEEIGLTFHLPALDDDLARADIRSLEQMPRLSASTEVGDMTVTISVYPEDAAESAGKATYAEVREEVR
jgi:hypothetical protein